jgi:hypothetical protein
MNDPALDALWKHVLDHWDDDRAHGVFLEHCQRKDQLLDAAVLYRGMSADRVRGPSAKKRMHAVALLAMAALDARRTSDRPASGHFGSLLLLTFLLFASAAVLWTFFIR